MLILGAILCTIAGRVCAQTSALHVINSLDNDSSNTKILLKWYSEDLVYPEGVNIYRRGVGQLNWDKINISPVFRKNEFTSEAVEDEDGDMAFLESLFLEGTPISEIKETFAYVEVLLKSIQSSEYADFLGIYYEDVTAKPGETYTYRVTRIAATREFSIAESKQILAGPHIPAAPINGHSIYEEGKRLLFDWQVEDDRFYAVNIYKSSDSSAVEEKINPMPILVTLEQDSLGNWVYPKPLYSEDSLEELETYTYELAALGFFNEEFQRTDPLKFTFGDHTPPIPPGKLSSKSDSMSVGLTWQNNEQEEEIAGINVYRSKKSDGPFERINEMLLPAETDSYVDWLDVHGHFYYQVAAVDLSGNEGTSTYTYVKVADVLPPLAPKGLTVETDTGRMVLRWNKNIEGDLMGYQVYRTTDTNTDIDYLLLNADVVTDTTFRQNLPINVKNKFFYRVVAVDTSFNVSPYSNFATGKLPDVVPPEKPFIKNIKYVNNSVLVEWVKNLDSDLKNYILERRDTLDQANFVPINTSLDGFSESFLDESISLDTYYEYRLIASDSVGNLSTPSEMSTAFIASPPQEISFEDLSISYKRAKKATILAWEVANSNDLLGFVVYRGDKEQNLRPLTGLIEANRYWDRGVNKEAEWYYQVRVYDKSGDTGKSEIVNWKKR